ncbi:hypothetical protein [Candidatus Enterococcus willemsii]|uniref:beta-fructofuranosidase n=1 Tax=Candidatus Enterococcus willemsii TaxID=1857215 RepID=A0ABQ6Z1M3_9ENTE|nr:hypothetical protein [Enterococcus sp. CU12B]KAF1305094.1 hypothetical protein BAU17_04775 [Enterococcus sp. CU12B]
MKKKVQYICMIAMFIILGACKMKTEVKSLYPRSADSFVGDPMPYFDGNEYKIYYLEDLRNGEVGFHPFSLFTTTDFYHYQDEGEVIPFVNEEDSPERALGTGSVIKDKAGKYHAFYTAHNSERLPKELIMHATSKDGKKWMKQPEDTFEGDTEYENNDFRDPYVFFEEESQSYWMLITTRQNNTGIIAKYTSTDLTSWENQGVFFVNDIGNDSNLECPSLVQFKGTWYLAFSDQWDKRVVHYRTADNPNGPFEKPEHDYVDGAGFYAGRLETDGQNLYQVGWIPTKDNHDDRFNYNWAGNLAVHQLIKKDGKLQPKLPEKAYQNLSKEHFPQWELSVGETVIIDSQATLLEGEFQVNNRTKFILSFGEENNILFDFNNRKMSYYNTHLEDIPNRKPQTEMSLTTEQTVPFQLIQEEDLVVIYDGEYALSNRIYQSKEKPTKLTLIEGSLEVK